MPTPSRPRDFQLTSADARHLRPRGLRAILAAIGSSRDAFSSHSPSGSRHSAWPGCWSAPCRPSGWVPGPRSSRPSAPRSTPTARARAVNQRPSPTRTATGPSSAGRTSPRPRRPPPLPPPRPQWLSDRRSPRQPPHQPAPSAAPASAGSGATREAAGASAAGASTGDGSTLTANDVGDGFLRLSSGPDGPSGLLIASIVMLVAGTGLFAARWAARRLRAT